MSKIIKQSELLDSRIYDDVCLLGKILCECDTLTKEDKVILKKHFEKK